jgi:NAD(P)-dependent dehydrogenase (short-subunit alcohol dehydrogenase family)
MTTRVVNDQGRGHVVNVSTSLGEIEDVVGGLLYLESAPLVTGEILHIDGGQSAGH